MQDKDSPNEKEQQMATPLNAGSYDASKRGGKTVTIKFVHSSDKLASVYSGHEVWLTADVTGIKAEDYDFFWRVDRGGFKDIKSQLIETGQIKYLQTETSAHSVCITTNGLANQAIRVMVFAKLRNPRAAQAAAASGSDGAQLPPSEISDEITIPLRDTTLSDLKGNLDQKMDKISETIKSGMDGLQSGVPVVMKRAAVASTDDVGLWIVIRRSAEALSFNNYMRFMDLVLCGVDGNGNVLVPNSPAEASAQNLYTTLQQRRSLPFNDTDAYRLLKVATEAFLLVNAGVILLPSPFNQADVDDLSNRTSSPAALGTLNTAWGRYLTSVNGTANPMLPYLALISQKFRNEPLKNQIFLNEDPTSPSNAAENCLGVLRRKLTQPFLLELIWSYWQEEGMLVQTLNAITRRFQNVRLPGGDRDPLANLEMDPLRPLNNLIWGVLADEQHRLSVVRRAYEYDHHYGISLFGKAIQRFRPADTRSKFIEAFHQLLHLCSIFFKQDDDTTVIADGFPILNALREVHLILSQGAHNQFGDLPSTARQEMLLQQWLLARPEFQNYLPTRAMVAYPEPWMDRVDAMKSLQGWTDTSVTHFHNLAVFGEQILLSVRFGAWSLVNQTAQSAANFARFWRPEIQGYIHSYRSVTGADLTSTSVSERADAVPPSVHLRNRLAAQRQRL